MGDGWEDIFKRGIDNYVNLELAKRYGSGSAPVGDEPDQYLQGDRGVTVQKGAASATVAGVPLAYIALGGAAIVTLLLILKVAKV